jgi:prepilin-type processing-associated H-X9-DG protein
MNADEMLDYALGEVDGPGRERVEREIAGDPRLAAMVDRLSRSVARLLDDGLAIEPPPGLAARTLSLVAERRRRRSILDFVPITVPFRWTDVAVAAGIFLASLLTLVPALQRAKGRMDQAGCVFNLQQLGLSLAQYAALHGHYPYAPPGQPNAITGTFAATLRDSGLLHDLSALDCPCNGVRHRREPLPEVTALPNIRSAAPDQYSRMLCWDYAYHAGFRREETGQPGPVPAVLATQVPLLADQPAHDDSRVLDGNSPNHGRRGQNVLFSDGHVGWFNTRRVSPVDVDLFLNAARQPGPGVDVHDAVLVPSDCPFTGW